MQALPALIAAIHTLPSVVAMRRDFYTTDQIVRHALVHAQLAFDAGVRAWYVQDTRDTPLGPTIRAETIALITLVGRALRERFPTVALGISLMGHGAREPLAIAHAVDAQFVRLKVYIGAMMKMEGLLTGCAHDAIKARHALNAEHIRIFADIYDRVGEPVSPLPLAEACRQAVEFGHADGLILTGKNVPHTLTMLAQAQPAAQGAPLLVGGGVTPANARAFLQHAHSLIVHGAFARKAPHPLVDGVPLEWDSALIAQVVQAAA